MDPVGTALEELRAAMPDAGPLVDELDRVVAAGGKRLRPRLVRLGYRAAGAAPDERLARAEAAVELVHIFAMLQDDIMDGALKRRGRAASHIAMAAPGRDPQHFGRSAALLAADLAFVWSDRVLRTSGFPDALLRAALDRWDDMRLAAVAGQYLDVLGAHMDTSDETQVRRAAQLKTSRYSVVGPLCIGAHLADAKPETLAALEAFGTPLGAAFQLVDDLLSITGDASATGKDELADLHAGTRTAVVLRALDLADEQQVASIRSSDASAAREAIVASGAVGQVYAEAEALVATARAALVDSPIEASAASALDALAGDLLVRDQ